MWACACPHVCLSDSYSSETSATRLLKLAKYNVPSLFSKYNDRIISCDKSPFIDRFQRESETLKWLKIRMLFAVNGLPLSRLSDYENKKKRIMEDLFDRSVLVTHEDMILPISFKCL